MMSAQCRSECRTPVSYTHLDVYKRQEDKLVGIGYETDEKTGEHTGIKITMFDISDSSSLKAVSYTHLDVYKRQAQRFPQNGRKPF